MRISWTMYNVSLLAYNFCTFRTNLLLSSFIIAFYLQSLHKKEKTIIFYFMNFMHWSYFLFQFNSCASFKAHLIHHLPTAEYNFLRHISTSLKQNKASEGEPLSQSNQWMKWCSGVTLT